MKGKPAYAIEAKVQFQTVYFPVAQINTPCLFLHGFVEKT